jgi:hypothetical protein
MAARTGTWLIAIGALFAFAGLCVLPAAFGPSSDRSMLGAGTVLFSLGLLLIAGALYVKAKALGGATPSRAAAAAKRARKSNCDRCGQDEPVIQCRVHHLHLCADCLAEHYDFRSCAYVPSTRRGTAKSAVAAYSQSTSA